MFDGKTGATVRQRCGAPRERGDRNQNQTADKDYSGDKANVVAGHSDTTAL